MCMMKQQQQYSPWPSPIKRPTRSQLKRTFHNFLLTLACGLTTLLVLRGTSGFENGLISDLSHGSDLLLHEGIAIDPPPSMTASKRILADSSTIEKEEEDQQDEDFDIQGKEAHQGDQQDEQFDHQANEAHQQDEQFDHQGNEAHQVSLLLPSTSSPHENEANLVSHQAMPNETTLSSSSSDDSQATETPPPPPSSSSSNGKPKATPPPSSSSKGKPSILLVTGSQPTPCDNPIGDYHLMKSLKNKMDYCRLHGLKLYYNMNTLDQDMGGFWAKLPLLESLMLAHPEVEWLWWMDSDALFTDMAFELPMDKYNDHNLVLHGWKELVYGQKNWIGLNTGSFLIRNCQWSLDLLHAWAPMGKRRDEAGIVLSKTLYGRPNFEADDQSALIFLITRPSSQWANKIFLENTYYLHGYWAIIVDKFEENMKKFHPGFGDERWPFVTHFVGCKPCSSKRNKLGETTIDKCLKQMERAYNFADNQVMRRYGFEHESLDTSKLKKISI